MAYAEVAGLNPVAGLWAALPALVVYALLGSSRSLSMGPESTTALMTAVAIGPLAAGSPARYAQLTASLALLAGLLAAAAWLLLGFLADLLSRPVLVGYLAGVGLIMIADQLGRVTGAPVTGELFFGQLASFARGVGAARPATMVLAAAVLAFLFLVHWRWPHAPAPLLAILLATAATAAFGLRAGGISVVGPIPSGLPVFGLPDLHPAGLRDLLLPAFSVMIVAFNDDVLTARSFAGRGERVRPNQELLALGVANAGASVLHGFPVSSSASRTAIAVATGSKTQAYSVATAGSVLIVLVFLRPVLASFPVAALGAIVIFAGVRLIDAAAPVRWFVLNVEANVEVDFTALEAVDAVRAELAARGAVFALARVKQDLLARLVAFGLAGKIGAQYLFPTLPTAVAAYEDWGRRQPPPV